MKKIILGLAAAAVLAAPLAIAGTANAAPAPAPAKATGNVSWVYDVNGSHYTGTVVFSANDKTGGTLDYTNNFGETLHGVVTPGTVVKSGNVVTFDGAITGGSANYFHGTGTDTFTAVVKDVSTSGSNGDEIAVFANQPAFDTHADVTGGNLTIH
jgi:hypothetical protein